MLMRWILRRNAKMLMAARRRHLRRSSPITSAHGARSISGRDPRIERMRNEEGILRHGTKNKFPWMQDITDALCFLANPAQLRLPNEVNEPQMMGCFKLSQTIPAVRDQSTTVSNSNS